MLDDAFNGPVLSACISSLEYHQHFVAMLDDVPLHLDELDLQLAKRCSIVLTFIWIVGFLGGLRHLILDLRFRRSRNFNCAGCQ